MLRDFFVALFRGGGGGAELSTELLDWKKNPVKIFWVCTKYCNFLDFEFIEKCYESFSQNLSGGTRTLNRTLGFKKNSLRNFLGTSKVLQFLGFCVYRKMLLEFFAELIRGGPELSTELVDLPTKNSANFRNFKNPVSLRVMIFAELYLRRTLELFFN